MAGYEEAHEPSGDGYLARVDYCFDTAFFCARCSSFSEKISRLNIFVNRKKNLFRGWPAEVIFFLLQFFPVSIPK